MFIQTPCIVPLWPGLLKPLFGVHIKTPSENHTPGQIIGIQSDGTLDETLHAARADAVWPVLYVCTRHVLSSHFRTRVPSLKGVDATCTTAAVVLFHVWPRTRALTN